MSEVVGSPEYVALLQRLQDGEQSIDIGHDIELVAGPADTFNHPTVTVTFSGDHVKIRELLGWWPELSRHLTAIEGVRRGLELKRAVAQGRFSEQLELVA